MHELSVSYFFDLCDFQHAALFDGCGYVWEVLSRISEYLKRCRLGEIEGSISSRAYLVDPHLISIGKGSVVEPGAYIKGPCILGRGSVVRHGAYIRGQVIAGDGAVIGHATEAKNSIFLPGAKAPHFAYVGDSVLGRDVNLGAGTRLANFTLRGSPVSLRFGDQLLSTGLRKFGAIVGDGCSLGCNSVAYPGTLLGKGVMAYPHAALRGFIAQDSLLKSQGEEPCNRLSSAQ